MLRLSPTFRIASHLRHILPLPSAARVQRASPTDGWKVRRVDLPSHELMRLKPFEIVDHLRKGWHVLPNPHDQGGGFLLIPPHSLDRYRHDVRYLPSGSKIVTVSPSTRRIPSPTMDFEMFSAPPSSPPHPRASLDHLINIYPRILNFPALHRFLTSRRAYSRVVRVLEPADLRMICHYLQSLRVFSPDGVNYWVFGDQIRGLVGGLVGYWAELSARSHILERRLPYLRKRFPNAEYISNLRATHLGEYLKMEASDGMIATVDRTIGRIFIHETYETKATHHLRTRKVRDQISWHHDELRRHGLRLHRDGRHEKYAVDFSPVQRGQSLNAAVFFIHTPGATLPTSAEAKLLGCPVVMLELDLRTLREHLQAMVLETVSLQQSFWPFPAKPRGWRRKPLL